jgi:hypothetical protein
MFWKALRGLKLIGGYWMKTRILKKSENTYKAYDDEEFIGYVVRQEDGKWLYNPLPDETLKSRVFDSYDELYDWLKWSDY